MDQLDLNKPSNLTVFIKAVIESDCRIFGYDDIYNCKCMSLAKLGALALKHNSFREFHNKTELKFKNILEQINKHTLTFPDSNDIIFFVSHLNPLVPTRGTECVYFLPCTPLNLEILRNYLQASSSWSISDWNIINENYSLLKEWTIAISLPKVVIHKELSQLIVWLSAQYKLKILGFTNSPHLEQKYKSVTGSSIVLVTFFPIDSSKKKQIPTYESALLKWQHKNLRATIYIKDTNVDPPYEAIHAFLNFKRIEKLIVKPVNNTSTIEENSESTVKLKEKINKNPFLTSVALINMDKKRCKRIRDALKQEPNQFQIESMGETKLYKTDNLNYMVGKSKVWFGMLNDGLVAIKTITKNYRNDLMIEIMMQGMDHNLIGIVSISQNFVVEELGVCNLLDVFTVFTLTDSVKTNPGCQTGVCLTSKHKEQFIDQLSVAILFLHKYNLVHQDIRPSNIIITTEMTCKLAYSETDFTKEQPFEVYFALKQEKKQPIIEKSIDMFMFGCTIYFILSDGEPVWDNHSIDVLEQKQPEKVISMASIPGIGCCYKYLLLWLLDHHAPSRPTIQQVRSHPALRPPKFIRFFQNNMFWLSPSPLLKAKWRNFWAFVTICPHFQNLPDNWIKLVPLKIQNFGIKPTSVDPVMETDLRLVRNILVFIRNGLIHAGESNHENYDQLFSAHLTEPLQDQKFSRTKFFLTHESTAWFHSALALYEGTMSLNLSHELTNSVDQGLITKKEEWNEMPPCTCGGNRKFYGVSIHKSCHNELSKFTRWIYGFVFCTSCFKLHKTQFSIIDITDNHQDYIKLYKSKYVNTKLIELEYLEKVEYALSWNERVYSIDCKNCGVYAKRLTLFHLWQDSPILSYDYRVIYCTRCQHTFFVTDITR